MNVLNYKKPAFWIVIAAIIAVAAICAGLMSNPVKGQLTAEDYANQFIEQQIAVYEQYEGIQVTIIDSKITRLEKIAEFDELFSSPLEIWRLEYRIKPDDISKAFLPGGMNAVDGWITEDSSMGKPILIFNREEAKLEYLGCIWDGEADFTALAGQETALRGFLESKALLPPETYAGNHVLVKFPVSTGEVCQLFLSQPVVQGDFGIWCVERWVDANGSVYYVTPQTEVKSMDYYEDLQRQCDNGHKSYLLNPLEVAFEYINEELGQHVSLDELVPKYSAEPQDYLNTPEIHLIGFISNFKADLSYFDFDIIEWLTLDDTERLRKLNIDPDEMMPSGFYIYNPDSYPMHYRISEQTQYSIINRSGDAAHDFVTREEFTEYLERNLDFTQVFRIITKDGYVQSITEQYLP